MARPASGRDGDPFESVGVGIGNSRAGKIGDGLDEGVSRDTLVDRPAFGADVVGESREHLLDRPPGEAFQVERSQRFANAMANRWS